VAVAIKHGVGGGAIVVLVVVVPAGFIWTPMLTLCAKDPLVPVTVNVNEPVDAEAPAESVSVELALEPEGGVTGPGRLIETSEGAVPSQEYAKVTAELKPLTEPMLIVDVPLDP